MAPRPTPPAHTASDFVVQPLSAHDSATLQWIDGELSRPIDVDAPVAVSITKAGHAALESYRAKGGR